jgi:hypothetical protein
LLSLSSQTSVVPRPLDDEIDLLVEMLLRIECAGARHLDDVTAPFALGAVQLDEAAFAAQPLPGRERQVLHLAYADAAVDRNAFRFHEQVIGRLRPAELSEAGAVAAGGFMPMRPAGQFVHGDAFDDGGNVAAIAVLPMLYCHCPGQGKVLATGRRTDARPALSGGHERLAVVAPA